MRDKITALKDLHKTVFEDGDNYIDFFFLKRFEPRYCWIHEENGEPAGAAYARSVTLNLGGKVVSAPFVTGVATHPDHRGKGIASSLMKKALAGFEKEKIPFSLLHPFNADFYRKLDYEAINFTNDITITCSPAEGVTCREITAGDIPLLFELYKRHANKLFAAAVRDENYMADIWLEHSQDGGTGYIIFKNGIPNGYILCGNGEVFESVCEDNSLLSAVKEIDGYKFRELFGDEPYSMAAAGDIPTLLTSVPLNLNASGEFRFSVGSENYLLSVTDSGGEPRAKCVRGGEKPGFPITKRQLISVALGGGKRYAEGVPQSFISLFPEYQIFMYDRY